MPPALKGLYPLIYRCSMAGVAPLDAGGQWTEAATDYFKQFIETPEFPDRESNLLNIFALKCEKKSNGIVDYRVRIDGSEIKNFVAEKMIEKGLAKEFSG